MLVYFVQNCTFAGKKLVKMIGKLQQNERELFRTRFGRLCLFELG